MALILDGNGLIQGLSAGGLPDGSVNASSLASTLDLSSKTMTFGNVSASGITFPASISASSNPNTLDDYEEGTFTPAISYETPGTLSITSTERFGTYTKIGRVVYFTIDYRISAFTKGTASGDLLLTGLPFAQRSTAGYDNARITIQLYSWEYSSSPFVGVMVPQGTGMALTRMVSNSTSTALNDPRAGSIIWATGFYFV